jgi:putative ABC transport system permease protein
MNFVALKMLTGDRAKYLGLIFAIAFCTFLLENQTSIFASILKRTGSQILDVTDADVWVMDGKTVRFRLRLALLVQTGFLVHRTCFVSLNPLNQWSRS